MPRRRPCCWRPGSRSTAARPCASCPAARARSNWRTTSRPGSATPRSAYLPQQEVLVFDRNSPDSTLVGDVLLGLDRLRGPEPVLAVTSLYGASQRVMAPAVLTRAVLRVRSATGSIATGSVSR